MSENSNMEAGHMFNMVKEKYGDRLNDEELEEVRKGVDRMAEMAQQIRGQKLENGDEPFSIFVPYRKEG